MRKSIQALLVAMALLLAVPAVAQVQWGIKLGANMSNTALKDIDLLKGENYTGFFVGPTIDVGIPVGGLGVDASLLYSMRGSKLKGVDKTDNLIEESLRQHAIEIPINLKYSFGMGSIAAIYIFAGPQFGFDLKSDNMADFVNNLADDAMPGKRAAKAEPLVESDKNFFKKAYFGINVGIGAKLLNHLQIAANYNIPLGKTAEYEGFRDTAVAAFSAKVKTWQVSIAYLF